MSIAIVKISSMAWSVSFQREDFHTDVLHEKPKFYNLKSKCDCLQWLSVTRQIVTVTVVCFVRVLQRICKETSVSQSINQNQRPVNFSKWGPKTALP